MAERLLVPVEESVTLRQTVAYAVRTVLESGDPDAVLHFVHIIPQRELLIETGPAPVDDDLLDKVAVWARSDAGDEEVAVETTRLGGGEYLFSPGDYARQIQTYARDHDVERVLLDPEYDPGTGVPVLRPLEYELARDDRLRIEEAPVERPARRAELIRPSGVGQYVSIFAVSYLFYLTLGAFTSAFDLVTGAISALVVAAALGHVTFNQDPHPVESARRLGRWLLYAPYLLWEITKANLAVSVVVLDPRRSIDPQMTEYRAAVWGDLPVTSLANSITLTPGTLTVRVYGRELLVHTLMPSAREDLFDGSLERAIRFVFYGRTAARIASPREREDVAVLAAADGAGGNADETDADGSAEGGDAS